MAPTRTVVQDDAPKTIKHLQFGVLSPQEIVAVSEVEVTDGSLYSVGGTERMPQARGVLDRKLGISDKMNTCETCGLKLADCVGHCAFIKLVLPVFHFGYFKQTITMLQDICKTCSRVMLEEEDRRKFLKQFRRPHLENLRRQKLAKDVNTTCRKTIYCQYCGAINGTVKKTGGLKIIHEKWRAKKVAEDRHDFEMSFQTALNESRELKPFLSRAQDDLNPLRVYKLFSAVSAEDCELLGLDPGVGRPEEFLWTHIPVPPVCIRPSVAQEAATNEDDLTVKLAEIVSANNLVKMSLHTGQASQTLMEQWDFLQATCAMYISADVPNVMLQQNPGMKPIRGLCQRLKGKQGRFRGNLCGKRVDFSARTVISPDPNLRVDEVAVPELVAKNMTYPERVTVHNFDMLRNAIANGTDVWPGANFVVHSAPGQSGNAPAMGAFGPKKRYLKTQVARDGALKDLKIGDVVERHLIDNDVVLFNRQPSLHKLSIMAHRAKIRPWRTFRFNEFVCNPYNADFDGDEMNLHVPQTEEARTEAAELMISKNNLVTPKSGEPIIAANQDFITGSYLLTRKDNFLTRHQFVHILSYLDDASLELEIPPPAVWKPQRLWTGKQVFNLLMRPNKKSPILVNLEAKNKTSGKPPPGYLPDMMDNDGYLVVRNSEIMCGHMDKATIGDGKKLSVYNVLLRDYGVDAAAVAMNRTAKLCARYFTNRGFSIGITDVTPGKRLSAMKDQKVATAYAEALRLIQLSKEGKLINQAGCNAEQTLEARISGVLSEVRGALGDICMQELSPHNAPLTMARCGSKGSLINVAQMVASVGQQIIGGKRVPNGFQDRSLPHFPKGAKDPSSKGFVANSFYTGLTPYEFLFHACSGREGLVDTAVKTAETGYLARRLMKALEDLSVRYDTSVRNSVGAIVQFRYGDDGLDPVRLEGDAVPVDFNRSWRHIRTSYDATDKRGLFPWQIAQLTKKTIQEPKFNICLPAFIQSVETFVREKIIDPAVAIRLAYGLDAAVEMHPSGKTHDFNIACAPDVLAVVNNKTKITAEQLKHFLYLCLHKYTMCKVEPGTAVGAIGAQSIGEPGTQMTLKTFHFAGVASMSITLGVPRIKEIINASKNISTPIITAPLHNDESEPAARVIKGRIEKTYLRDICSVIAPAVSKNEMYISVHVDMDTISRLRLEVNLETVREAILKAPKLKIADVHIVSKKNRLRVLPALVDERARLKTPSKYQGITDHSLLLDLFRSMPDIVVKGIGQCTRAVISRNDKKKLELAVEGQGLRAVMTTDGVIGAKTTTNHIMEVEKVLGIEAARRTVQDEIGHVMGNHGLSVDPRHLTLLADCMTAKGEVLGITRFGISKMKDSVLMLASFEKTTDHLFEGAFYGKRDAIHGVSECIIMGNPANSIGTALPALVSNPIALPPRRRLAFEEAA